MPILKHVHIKAFKSILDQRIELGQLNVFIGTNGSGKSNILEAIGMLSAAATGEIDYSRLADRGVRLSSPEVFRSAFSRIERKHAFFIEGGFDDFLYHAHITSVGESIGRFQWGYHAEKIVRGSDYRERIAGRSNSFVGIQNIANFDKTSLQRHKSILNTAESLGVFKANEMAAISALREYAIFAPSTPILRGIANDESRKSPLGLYGGGMSKALSEIMALKDNRLNKYIIRFFKLLDWFSSVGVAKPEPSLQSSHVHTGPTVVSFTDKFMPKNFKQLYAYDVSEGALYVLFVLLLLANPNAPNIFALDNVDNALNPSLVTALVEDVAKYLSENPDKQVFMTSHNPTTLDAIDLFNSSHRLFVVKRGVSGATEFERISPPRGMSREQWQEKYGYMKLSEIWLSGTIDGLNPPPKGF
ncbi:AAA family ATPase [Geobacter sp.]|uniref:AAA family ATPase n=1 Tax=Geobacter sp. TaxID=46610 RepID=UPI0026321B58|nr:AAA family ATPase [Geobacter sp.]